MFAHRHIVFQVLLVDSTKGAQEVSHLRPQTLNRVRVNFSNSIAIVITRPFFLAMIDCGMRATQVVIAAPLVAVASCSRRSVLLNVAMKCPFVGSRADSQATLPAAPPNGPHNRWAVILVCAMTAPFVGTSAWRIIFVLMTFSFFPPRSETSRLFQSAGLAKQSLPASGSRSVAVACATREWFGVRVQVLRREPNCFRLYTRRARVRPLVAVSDCCR